MKKSQYFSSNLSLLLIALLISFSLKNQASNKQFVRVLNYSKVEALNGEFNSFLQAKPIELFDLINLFAPDQKFDYNLYDWKTEANNKSINWLTSGVKMGEHDFYRKGESVVSIDGKVLECFENTSQPCKWDIVLRGVRNGYTSFEISSVTSPKIEVMTIDQLFKNHKFEAKIITYDDLSKTYQVTFPHKKPIEMKIQYSCGSEGCLLTITCNTIN